ncbi:monocarboxylate transporter 14 [Diachasmimorpha longicaudata]|uniref:monocarboxylate transporter 14 n=1 Tax=Diachasmimorpha longicaudata TaxID=58733 RepID=UPI0030B8FE47
MALLTENKGDCCESTVRQNGHPPGKTEEIPMVSPNDNNNEVEVEMIVPPDGGWGWVIVAASFMCNLIVDGIIFSFGVFLPHISRDLNISEPSVALVGSLQTGFYLMAGPFVSALANRYGFRLVAMVGSVISCVAFILSSYCSSVELLCITYGLIGGVGGGLIYVPAVITTGFYFERWRALATGIAVCGSGIGAFVLAPISSMLIDNFGWRTAMQIQSAMLLNCAVFGSLFRPLRPKRIKVKQSEVAPEAVVPEVKTSLLKNGVSTTSLHGSQLIAVGWRFGTNNNAEYPTAAEAIGSIPNLIKSADSLHNRLSENEKPLTTTEKRLSAPIYPEMDVIISDEIKSTEEENNLLSGDLERLNGRIPTVRRHTISGRRDQNGSECSLRKAGKRHSISKDPQRPFYRDDIFYGGSLARLPHYKSQMSSVGYHMSVTRLPTATDVEEEESGNCYLCPESVRRILTTMLDINLLGSPSFLILAISGGLTMMGFYTPFMFLPGRAESMDLKDSATFLVSVIGIANTVGRVICGLVSSLPGMDTLLINNVFISISGILTICSGLSYSKEYQYFYAAAFGFSISVFAALRSILVVDLMGLEKLTNAFGLILLFQGIAASVGAPLTGAVKVATDSFDVAFYVSGALILLSAIICYPLKWINEWEKRKNEPALTNP